MAAPALHPFGASRSEPAGRTETLRLAALAFALITVALLARHAGQFFAFPADAAAAGPEDLVVFHAIGAFVADGNLAGAYDPGTFADALPDANKGAHWLNPPHAALMFAPLHGLPYGVAKAIWLVVTLAATVTAAILVAQTQRALWAGLSVLSPAFVAGIFAVNLGAPVAAGMVAVIRLSASHPAVAGAIAGVLTIKPQYGVLLVAYLAGAGRWPAIGWAIAATLALVAGSILAYGLAPWAAFFTASAGVHAAHGLEMHRGTVNLAQLLIKAGAPAVLAAGAGIACLALAAVGVWHLARRAPVGPAMGWALVATPLVAPSAWIYDWPIVAAGLIALASSCALSRPATICAAAVWAAPIIPIFVYGKLAASVASLSLLALMGISAAGGLRRYQNSIGEQAASHNHPEPDVPALHASPKARPEAL